MTNARLHKRLGEEMHSDAQFLSGVVQNFKKSPQDSALLYSRTMLVPVPSGVMSHFFSEHQSSFLYPNVQRASQEKETTCVAKVRIGQGPRFQEK